MAETPDISLHLSRVLDEIGMNEVTVKKRRDTFLFIERKYSLLSEIFYSRSTHFFGSQTEGTTTPGLNSDADQLLCHHNFKIIQNSTEWTQGKQNLLTLRENTAPGYCRLQLLKQIRPEPEETMPTLEYAYDEFNRILIKNSGFDRCDSDYPNLQVSRNGPAETLNMSTIIDTDITHAFMCTSRLDATEQWARRTRPGGWPSASLIKQVVNESFYIVPVGYKLSSTKNMEWRISTSLGERCLMFSLNMVQIKCYVVLKILVKTFVTPVVGKSITSYHCKTALFYCMENTETEFWRDDNLLRCITRCLEMLLTWITDEFCPHFIIAEASLFAGKVTSDNKDTLQHVLHGLIQWNVKNLLAVSMDDIGSRLLKKLDTVPNDSPTLYSMNTVKILGRLENRRQLSYAAVVTDISLYTQAVATSMIRKAKSMLESRTNFSDKLQLEVTGQVIMFLNNLLGSILASSSICQHDSIPHEAIELFEASDTFDMSTMLKQASILLCSGAIEKVEQLCRLINCYFNNYNISFPVCQCYSRKTKYIPMYDRRHMILYAHCVTFTPHETHCIPQALRNELFIGEGDLIHLRQSFGNWMVLAVIDCLPFLYYLQYMTYRELGRKFLSQMSLRNLERCIIEDNQLMGHVETAWNILGQCYEMENQPVAALHCYRKSLDIRLRNNAGNWISFYRSTQRP